MYKLFNKNEIKHNEKTRLIYILKNVEDLDFYAVAVESWWSDGNKLNSCLLIYRCLPNGWPIDEIIYDYEDRLGVVCIEAAKWINNFDEMFKGIEA